MKIMQPLLTVIWISSGSKPRAVAQRVERFYPFEYWVKPTNREGEGWNRVGIVGQNDAVEYGFINGTTIQTDSRWWTAF